MYIYIYGWYTHVYECIHIIHDRAIDVFSLYIYILYHINNSTDIPSWDTCRKPKVQSPDARNHLRSPANRVIMQLELCNVRLGTRNICLGVFSTSMKIVYTKYREGKAATLFFVKVDAFLPDCSREAKCFDRSSLEVEMKIP